jgi:molybdenum cofactor cytidylyltransferase
MNIASIHVIVLAAGEGTRFGSAKQLACTGGVPMLHSVLRCAIASVGDPITVVLGAYADTIAPTLDGMPVSIVVNSEWREGIASSIRIGLQRTADRCDGAMLLLGDQAAITSIDLQRLAAAWRRDPTVIVAAQYSNGCGVPAIFPRIRFKELAALRGDRGAKCLLEMPKRSIISVEMSNAALDVDTPLDLQVRGSKQP